MCFCSLINKRVLNTLYYTIVCDFLDNMRDCKNYNLTSQAEEEEVDVGKRRKRSKRAFDDYVVGTFLTKQRNLKHGHAFIVKMFNIYV